MFVPFNMQPLAIKQEPVDDEEAGYGTDEYYDEQGRRVMEIDYSKIDAGFLGGSKQYHVLDTGSKRSKPPKTRRKKKKNNTRCFPKNTIHYTMEDMNPQIWDPRCSSNTDLACFWPVYVDNFKGNNVTHYFASRGLHARWWFHKDDGYYRQFQRKARLYDLLVYFVSERDAKLAIELCHRDTYRGYKLNVFPGREPVYFEKDRSVFVKNMKGGFQFSEHFFEQHANENYNVKVSCVVKFGIEKGALEFENPDDVLKAQQMEKKWTYVPVKKDLQKQRFLEKDVIEQIHAFLIENPNSLMVDANDWIVKLLLNGHCPFPEPNNQVVFPINWEEKPITKWFKKNKADKF